MFGNNNCCSGLFGSNDGILFFILVFLLLFGCCGDTGNGDGCCNN